jgi:hypothetical protein
VGGQLEEIYVREVKASRVVESDKFIENNQVPILTIFVAKFGKFVTAIPIKIK